ncbi:MAG: DUF86 domain-containing protein [Armatimonadetes bacterium]|nr:DUF86 domain-containing protein [Armatimonadota bacterium]
MPSKLQLLPPDIEEKLQRLPEEVAKVEGLVALWLFGSFARGEATPISDVDLAYLPDESLTGKELERFDIDLYITISHTLTTDEFTLVNLRQAPAYFAWQVLSEGKLLFCRDNKQCAIIAERIFQLANDGKCYKEQRWSDLEEWLLEGKTMRVDKERVYSLLDNIREELGYLEEFASMSLGDYINDPRTQRLAERCLQRAAESGISIGNHIISRLRLRAPKDYADVFKILAEAQVLPYELAQQMMDMARFRNLLVHLYWEIDHNKVHESLPQRIEVLKTFSRRIVEWMKE